MGLSVIDMVVGCEAGARGAAIARAHETVELIVVSWQRAAPALTRSRAKEIAGGKMVCKSDGEGDDHQRRIRLA